MSHEVSAMPRRVSNKRKDKERTKTTLKLKNKCLFNNHLIDAFENEWGCCKRCSEWVHVTDFIRAIKQI